MYPIIISKSTSWLAIGALVALSGLGACKSDDLRGPIENDKTPPSAVKNVQVENRPGGALITYSVPSDRDLLKVVAQYEIRPGVKHEAVCSAFDHKVLVQGFGSVGSFPVKLYAVDKSNNWSEAVTVNADPLLPPFRHTYQSMDYDPFFGGLIVTFDNPSKADLVFTTVIKDSVSGEWVDFDKNFTNLEGGEFLVSGLPPVNREFGISLKDQWDNVSDTLFKTMTPLLEESLNATGRPTFFILPGDDTEDTRWDLGRLLTGPHGTGAGYGNYTNNSLPHTITIDLGGLAKISRFRTFPISGNRVYQESNVKDFEIWGSNDPNPNGEYDSSWHYMGRYTVTKPSGLPYGQVNAADQAIAAAGDEFLLDFDSPEVRYIRIKILSTFTTPEDTPGLVWLTGFKVWGQYKD